MSLFEARAQARGLYVRGGGRDRGGPTPIGFLGEPDDVANPGRLPGVGEGALHQRHDDPGGRRQHDRCVLGAGGVALSVPVNVAEGFSLHGAGLRYTTAPYALLPHTGSDRSSQALARWNELPKKLAAWKFL